MVKVTILTCEHEARGFEVNSQHLWTSAKYDRVYSRPYESVRMTVEQVTEIGNAEMV